MTAQQLIDLLCVPLGQTASAWRSERREHEHCIRHAGFAGYPFSNDGYEFQAHATSQTDPVVAPQPQPGLRIWPDVGDWPYVVFLRSPAELAIVEYCEGDVAISIYDDQAAYQHACAQLCTEQPCP